jgi:hypothetical protein
VAAWGSCSCTVGDQAKRPEDEMDVEGSLEPAHQHSQDGFAPANRRVVTRCNAVVVDCLVA